jgi:protein-S-isoprenylcysteine O-methyltransferase Ste14
VDDDTKRNIIESNPAAGENRCMTSHDRDPGGHMKSESESGTRHNILAGIALRAVTMAVFLAFNMALLFIAAGRLAWVWPWVYLGICLVSVSINASFMLRTNPETAAERGTGMAKIQGWDRVVSVLWSLALYLALPIIAGLDIRYGWSGDLNLAIHIGGAVLLALGLGLAGWAMIANAYFSTAVRIQSERGHTVCTTGPYRIVRHPGYAGFALQAVGTPLLLGSWWALFAGAAAIILGIIRTSYEDRMLQSDLPGYAEYTKEVRYRLFPGIW